jgi:ComF family protein
LEDFWTYLWKLLLLNESIRNKQEYLLIPTPMYFFRQFSRWYNHSEVLANNIWKITWIKVNNKIVKRIKNTKQQSKLSKKDRLSNLKEAFSVNRKLLKKLKIKKLILVDDIVSTWTTLNEISELLRKSWTRKIIWLCIASH